MFFAVGKLIYVGPLMRLYQKILNEIMLFLEKLLGQDNLLFLGDFNHRFSHLLDFSALFSEFFIFLT